MGRSPSDGRRRTRKVRKRDPDRRDGGLMTTSQAPWEDDADRYGQSAARVLWGLPITCRSEGRRILDGGQTLDRLIAFDQAIRDFGAPRRPQPRAYRTTLGR